MGRACMKKLRIEVPEDCIEMPVQEVLVHITINDTERIPIRCVIHYRNSPKVVGWMHIPHEPLLPEQQEELSKTPRNRVGQRALEEHGESVLLPYRAWRQKRDEQLKC